EWWVHSVNASGVYSGLTKKVIVECPKPTTSGTPAPQGVGAGQLIVLPPITTTPQTVVLPTATPTPKP
nr:hypothetical protein [Candidatus Levybacteria bacterium]